jgi:hypothetical protein
MASSFFKITKTFSPRKNSTQPKLNPKLEVILEASEDEACDPPPVHLKAISALVYETPVLVSENVPSTPVESWHESESDNEDEWMEFEGNTSPSSASASTSSSVSSTSSPSTSVITEVSDMEDTIELVLRQKGPNISLLQTKPETITTEHFHDSIIQKNNSTLDHENGSFYTPPRSLH